MTAAYVHSYATGGNPQVPRRWHDLTEDEQGRVLGETHTIVVGVHDGYMPRERYSVNVTPALAYSPTNITKLQRLADQFGCEIAYINGSFTFAKGDT